MKPPCCPEKVWLLCRAFCELSVQLLQLVNTSSVWGPNVKGFVVTMCKSFSRWRFLMSFEYMDGAQASKDVWANQWEKKCSKQEQLCQTTRLPGCLMMSRFGHKSYEMPRVEGSLKLRYVQNSLRLIGASICSSSLDIFFFASSQYDDIKFLLPGQIPDVVVRKSVYSSEPSLFLLLYFFVYFVLVVI